jgi:hypothetical protein
MFPAATEGGCTQPHAVGARPLSQAGHEIQAIGQDPP